jgi:hypothetical protein
VAPNINTRLETKQCFHVVFCSCYHFVGGGE